MTDIGIEVTPARFGPTEDIQLASLAPIGLDYQITMRGFLPLEDRVQTLQKGYRIDTRQQNPVESHALQVLDEDDPFIRVHFYEGKQYLATASLDFQRHDGFYIPAPSKSL